MAIIFRIFWYRGKYFGKQEINIGWKLKLFSKEVWHPLAGQNETWGANENQLSEMTLGPLIEGVMKLKFEISLENSTSNISETIEITVSKSNTLHFCRRCNYRNNR